MIPKARPSDVPLIEFMRSGHLDCKRVHTEVLIDAGFIELEVNMYSRRVWTITAAGRHRVRQLYSSLPFLKNDFRRVL
jgi:hypothetical protein